MFSPSPVGGSSLSCCTLLDGHDEDRFEVGVWDRTDNRSFSINTNFLFRASISFSLRRSSACTSVKPSSHSLLISTTAALASISMIEVNLLWKATQFAMLSRVSTSASSSNVRLTFSAGQVTQRSQFRLLYFTLQLLFEVKTWKCNTIVTGNAAGHVIEDVRCGLWDKTHSRLPVTLTFKFALYSCLKGHCVDLKNKRKQLQ